jgi:hypothetical protein
MGRAGSGRDTPIQFQGLIDRTCFFELEVYEEKNFVSKEFYEQNMVCFTDY